MHNVLDESFHINALKELRVGTKVKYPRLAIIFALLVFCEVAQRSSYGMSRFDVFFSPCVMLMQWSGPKLHETRLVMFACIGIAFQSVPMHGTSVTFLLGLVSSVTFFLFFRLRWIYA